MFYTQNTSGLTSCTVPSSVKQSVYICLFLFFCFFLNMALFTIMFAFVSMNHLFYHQCSLVFVNIVSVFFFHLCPLLSSLLPLTFFFFFFCSFFSFSSFLFSYSFLKRDDTYNLWYIVVSLHPYISVFSVVVVFCWGLFGLCCIFIFMFENRFDVLKCLSRMPGLLMFIWATAGWTNTSPPQNKSWLNWSYKT